MPPLLQAKRELHLPHQPGRIVLRSGVTAGVLASFAWDHQLGVLAGIIANLAWIWIDAD